MDTNPQPQEAPRGPRHLRRQKERELRKALDKKTVDIPTVYYDFRKEAEDRMQRKEERRALQAALKGVRQ